MPTESTDTETKRKEPSFWDSLWALALLVGAILLARFFIMEPFKIPSGSMEPTLIGHEDYGDRIVTNKLAYTDSMQVIYVLAGSVLLIAVGFIASKAWQRKRSMISSMLLLVGVVGGICMAWSREAVASVPKRFEVIVFQYDTAWSGGPDQKINYIKRMCGLPGDTIVINGGDLFLRDKNGDDKIIRKWQEGAALQEQFWYPVNKAWTPLSHHNMSPEDKAAIAFPWKLSGDGAAGAKVDDKSLSLDGGAVEVAYPPRVTNLHIKQGRWLFKHVDCPAAHKPGIKDEKTGVVWSNPENAPSEFVRAYVNNPWEGVQCPQCKQVFFPLELGRTGLQPWQPSSPVLVDAANRLADRGEKAAKAAREAKEGKAASTDSDKDDTAAKNEQAAKEERAANEMDSRPPEVSRFFYGGDDTVGDLKLDMDIDVQSGGTIQIEVGSDVHSARWTIGGAAPSSSETAHDVKASTPTLANGKHSLSLAYVDGTVIAVLDGKEIERQSLDIQPIGSAAGTMQSRARMSFNGTKGAITRLDLFRDQYYMPMLKKMDPLDSNPRYDKPNTLNKSRPGSPVKNEEFDESRLTTVYKVAPDHYLMMGDNAPSSSDSRIWGLVPKENIVGRASFIWWPPSRWRIITHGEGKSSETGTSAK